MTDHPPLTADEIAAIRARAQAATPGPWEAPESEWSDPHVVTTDGEWIAAFIACYPEGAIPMDAADATFIAHARTDIERLLAAVERWKAVAQGYLTEHPVPLCGCGGYKPHRHEPS